MKRAAKVLSIYLLFLLVFSFILSWWGLTDSFLNVGKIKAFSPMMLATIVGGIISLYYTVSPKALKIFLIVYGCLWVIRIGMLYLAERIGIVTIGQRVFHFEIIIPNYYENVSRIGTPLPFIIFWFLNHIFFTKENTIETNTQMENKL